MNIEEENDLKRIISIGVGIILLFVFSGCILGQEKNITGSKIIFSKTADDSITSKTEWIYDLNTISRDSIKTTALIYGKPKKTDYEIINRLGLNTEQWEEKKHGELKYRVYGKYDYKQNPGVLSGAYAEIDEYGTFSFYQEEPIEGTSLSDAEASQAAYAFLTNHGLWNENMNPEPKIRRTTTYNSDIGTETKGKDVYVRYYRKANEYGEIYGNSRIDVEIGETGGIRSVIYNYREYTDSQEVELIPVTEAFENARKTGNVKWELESLSSKLSFETVQIRYYVNDVDPDQLFMQPIYIFAGTSYDSQGDKEHFGMFVQANRTP